MQKLTDITPKPTTVVELLENHPERWCKGSMYRSSRYAYNPSCHRVYAEMCCLGGAINLIYGSENGHIVDKVVPIIIDLTHDKLHSISRYNDMRETTHADIVALARRAGI